jgi:hypothetical protein
MVDFEIKNKEEVIKIVKEYFETNQEDREYKYIHFYFAHSEDRERAAENELSGDETLEIECFEYDCEYRDIFFENSFILDSLEIEEYFEASDSEDSIDRKLNDFCDNELLRSLQDYISFFQAEIRDEEARIERLEQEEEADESKFDADLEANRDLAEDAI